MDDVKADEELHARDSKNRTAYDRHKHEATRRENRQQRARNEGIEIGMELARRECGCESCMAKTTESETAKASARSKKSRKSSSQDPHQSSLVLEGARKAVQAAIAARSPSADLE